MSDQDVDEDSLDRIVASASEIIEQEREQEQDSNLNMAKSVVQGVLERALDRVLPKSSSVVSKPQTQEDDSRTKEPEQGGQVLRDSASPRPPEAGTSQMSKPSITPEINPSSVSEGPSDKFSKIKALNKVSEKPSEIAEKTSKISEKPPKIPEKPPKVSEKYPKKLLYQPKTDSSKKISEKSADKISDKAPKKLEDISKKSSGSSDQRLEKASENTSETMSEKSQEKSLELSEKSTQHILGKSPPSTIPDKPPGKTISDKPQEKASEKTSVISDKPLVKVSEKDPKNVAEKATENKKDKSPKTLEEPPEKISDKERDLLLSEECPQTPPTPPAEDLSEEEELEEEAEEKEPDEEMNLPLRSSSSPVVAAAPPDPGAQVGPDVRKKSSAGSDPENQDDHQDSPSCPPPEPGGQVEQQSIPMNSTPDPGNEVNQKSSSCPPDAGDKDGQDDHQNSSSSPHDKQDAYQDSSSPPPPDPGGQDGQGASNQHFSSPCYNVPDDIFVEDEVVSFSGGEGESSSSPQQGAQVQVPPPPWRMTQPQERQLKDGAKDEKEKPKETPIVDEENIENIEKFLQIEEAKAKRRGDSKAPSGPASKQSAAVPGKTARVSSPNTTEKRARSTKKKSSSLAQPAPPQSAPEMSSSNSENNRKKAASDRSEPSKVSKDKNREKTPYKRPGKRGRVSTPDTAAKRAKTAKKANSSPSQPAPVESEPQIPPDTAKNCQKMQASEDPESSKAQSKMSGGSKKRGRQKGGSNEGASGENGEGEGEKERPSLAKKRRTSRRVAKAALVLDKDPHESEEKTESNGVLSRAEETQVTNGISQENPANAQTVVESEKEKTVDQEGLVSRVEESKDDESNAQQPSKVLQLPKLGRKKSKSKKPTSSSSKVSKTSSNPNAGSSGSLVKVVQNWRKVIRVPGFDDRLTTSQIFKPALPTYIPCVPRNTSQRLIDTLSDEDLDQIVCPGCRDRFLIPASFFKHVYRKSVEIQFACQSCKPEGGNVPMKTFHNACQLKMHVLSHLEIDGVGSVGTDTISVQPIGSEDLSTGFVDESFARELDLAHEAVERDSETSLVQCLECKLSIEATNVQSHYENEDDPKRIVECETCSMALPNPCSLSAHKRVHERLKPFVCPECGSQFQTWSVFQTHLQTSCQHEFRTLAMCCRLCSRKTGQHEDVLVDSRNLLSHMFDKHVKLYYKCTGCSKAFDSKASIYEHRSSAHADANENEADFHLMYKATFLSAPNNLFKSRESFEQKVLSVTRNWDRGFLFKCLSCQSFFESRDDLRRHNQRWCQMQNQQQESGSDSSTSSGNDVSSSKLFPSPKKAKSIDREMQFEEKLAELKELCPTGSCHDCSDLLSRIRIHFNAHADKDCPDDSVQDQPRSQDNDRSSGRIGTQKNKSSQQQDEVVIVSKEVQRLVTTLVAEEGSAQGRDSPRVRPKRSHSEMSPMSRSNSPAVSAVQPSPSAVSLEAKKKKEAKESSVSLSLPLKSSSDLKQKEVGKPAEESITDKEIDKEVEVLSQSQTSGTESPEKLKPHLLKKEKSTHIQSSSPLPSGSKKVGQGRGRPSKKAVPEAKPFVETLGIDVPSNRTLLAFNRLHKKALSLGSSVVQKNSSASFKCRICGFKSEFRDGFQAHIRIHRPRENPEDSMQCLECGMCFASQPAWKTHLLLLHGIKKPKPEDFCQDLVMSPLGTPDLRDTTTDEDSESNLVMNEQEGKLVTPRQNVCQVCKKAFSTPVELRKHFRGHGMAFLKNIPPTVGSPSHASGSNSS